MAARIELIRIAGRIFLKIGAAVNGVVSKELFPEPSPSIQPLRMSRLFVVLACCDGEGSEKGCRRLWRIGKEPCA